MTRIGICLFTVACASITLGKNSTIPLKDLIRQSSLVVVAKVERIERIAGIRVATAKIDSHFKGTPASTRVTYLIEPTWTCDSSTAKVGEVVLLCLFNRRDTTHGIRTKDFFSGGLKTDSGARFSDAFDALERKGETLYVIGHSGAGRVPVFKRKDEWRCEAWRRGPKGPWYADMIELPQQIRIASATNNEAEIPLRTMFTKGN